MKYTSDFNESVGLTFGDIDCGQTFIFSDSAEPVPRVFMKTIDSCDFKVVDLINGLVHASITGNRLVMKVRPMLSVCFVKDNS